jgi:DNA invertase Pin-like site-specific DNA recombinase
VAITEKKNAKFHSLGDASDDPTMERGRLMLPTLSKLARFEHDLMRSRIGRECENRHGAKLRRKPKLTRGGGARQ